MVRNVPNSYAQCITLEEKEKPIDVFLAQSQHQSYVRALKEIGLKVIALDANEKYPDCCFIEDTAVVIDDLAIITLPGAPSRAGEVKAVETALETLKKTIRINPPATLDGGDVMIIDKSIFVGMSRRTNIEGIDQLQKWVGPMGYTVVPVPLKLGAALHLKSAATYVGNGIMLIATEFIDEKTFKNFDCIALDKSNEYAANCLNINGKVLMPKGYDSIVNQLESKGFEVITLDMSEFKKGDGALTCLSLIF